MRLITRLAAVILTAAALTAPGLADNATQAAAPAGAMTLSARYSGSVLAIPVGRVELSARLGQDSYTASATAVATGLAALFTDVRIDSEVSGAITRGRARPVSYAHDERTGRKHRRIDMSFDNRIARATAVPNFSTWGDPPATDSDRAGAIDPMTAVLMLSQSMTGRRECSGLLPVFDGRHRYSLRLQARGREHVRTPAWQGEAIVCDAFYEPISGYTDRQRPSPRDLRHPLTLWLAPLDNGHHLPVRLQTRAGFGVLIELNSLEMSPA
ncbi:DUF3108 domain-containing protein [Hyphomonadaceae bacterium ML37]|nr:DUF3108 domain-containing protein [Hyphomonadaceae bacterium ML37]